MKHLTCKHCGSGFQSRVQLNGHIRRTHKRFFAKTSSNYDIETNNYHHPNDEFQNNNGWENIVGTGLNALSPSLPDSMSSSLVQDDYINNKTQNLAENVKNYYKAFGDESEVLYENETELVPQYATISVSSKATYIILFG